MLPLLLAPSSLGLHRSPLLRQSRAVQRSSATAPMRMVALDPLVSSDMSERFDLPLLSGLQGKAMLVEKEDIPTKAQVREAVPKHCFERDTAKSLMYAAISVAQSAACVAVGAFIPVKAVWAPVWLAWAAFTGTVWTGMWVVAHECGHGAFSDNRDIQARARRDLRLTLALSPQPQPHRARARRDLGLTLTLTLSLTRTRSATR